MPALGVNFEIETGRFIAIDQIVSSRLSTFSKGAAWVIGSFFFFFYHNTAMDFIVSFLLFGFKYFLLLFIFKIKKDGC